MKNSVRVALAQFRAERGNISKNIEAHKKLCASAASQGAKIIMFPELSLTGYEPDLLPELAIGRSSPLIKELSNTAVEKRLTVIAGCPLRSGRVKPYIGAVIFHPNGEVNYYKKQYLHQGENEYSVAGDENYSFSVDQVKFTLAVCADFTEPQHFNDAKDSNTDVYLVSALISKRGFLKDSGLLSSIANTLNIPVLLSNFVGETGGWDTAGQSSVWDHEGEIVIQGDESHEGITVCTISNGKISDVRFQMLKRTNWPD